MSAQRHEGLDVVTEGRTCSADPVYASQLEEEFNRRKDTDWVTLELFAERSSDLTSRQQQFVIFTGQVLRKDVR